MSKAGKGVALAVHFGQTLRNQADMYPNIPACMKELVSNGLDAGASRIEVIYDLKSRSLVVRDNGKGRSPEDFQRDLMNVGNSSKRGNKNQIGRYGIGMMSPLGKCARFVFTSWDGRKDEPYIEFTFDCKAIIESPTPDTGKNGLVIKRERGEVVHETRGKTSPGRTAVWWKSEMVVHTIMKDKALTRFDIDEFVHVIHTNLNKSMLAQNTSVSVMFTNEEGHEFKRDKIQGIKFAGRALEAFVHKPETPDQVTFHLHIAPRIVSGYKGEVAVQLAESSVFTLAWKQVSKQLRDLNYISQDAAEALSSGFFEGDIISSRCVLHKGRASLENNDALIEFGIAIDAWFTDAGSKEYRSIRTNEREQRFNDLGTHALGLFKEAVLRNESLRKMLEQLKAMCKFGSVGRGHSPVPGKQPNLPSLPGIAVNNKNPSGSETKFPSKDKESTDSPGFGDKPGHSPIVHISPENGFPRKRTVGDSLGLHVMQTEDTISDRLWTFDDLQGVVHINVLHPLWAKHEKSDKALTRLQVTCFIQAVAYMLTRPSDRESVATAQQQELLMFDHLLI